jgi:hypothetical protein
VKSIEEIQRALDENKQQYSITQEKIREALSPEMVKRLTVSEHQEMLAPLYRQSERVSKEFRTLKVLLAKAQR